MAPCAWVWSSAVISLMVTPTPAFFSAAVARSTASLALRWLGPAETDRSPVWETSCPMVSSNGAEAPFPLPLPSAAVPPPQPAAMSATSAPTRARRRCRRVSMLLPPTRSVPSMASATDSIHLSEHPLRNWDLGAEPPGPERGHRAARGLLGDEVDEDLADDRPEREPVPGQAGRVHQPVRAGVDDRQPVGRHVDPPRPGAADAGLADRRDQTRHRPVGGVQDGAVGGRRRADRDRRRRDGRAVPELAPHGRPVDLEADRAAVRGVARQPGAGVAQVVEGQPVPDGGAEAGGEHDPP